MALQSKSSVLKSAVSTGWLDVKVGLIKAHDPALRVKEVSQPDSWAVQLFRSIDSGELPTLMTTARFSK